MTKRNDSRENATSPEHVAWLLLISSGGSTMHVHVTRYLIARETLFDHRLCHQISSGIFVSDDVNIMYLFLLSRTLMCKL